jgi:hypothetical protein
VIELQEFLKVYGSDGVEFFPADSDAVELYTGLEILKIVSVNGYGVPLTDSQWEVFATPERAEEFYEETVGELTSSNFVFNPKGVRERVEFDYA